MYSGGKKSFFIYRVKSAKVMDEMLLKRGIILDETFCFRTADVRISGGMIQKIAPEIAADQEEILDCKEKYILPGLIDIHIHGCCGDDFCIERPGALDRICEYQLKNGVTSFLPTSMALDLKTLVSTYQSIAAYMCGHTAGAEILGVRMEGPFFAKGKKGAQEEKYIRNPDVAYFETLNRACGNRIRIVDLAPELDEAIPFLEAISGKAVPAMAHTEASYEVARDALRKGIGHVTHLYNAMPPFLHRAPGAVGAALESTATCELICDGIHLHPAVLRLTVSMLGPERTVFVSDSMAATGIGDGTFFLGTQEITVSQNIARTAQGALAGASVNLYAGVLRAIEMGIRPELAFRAASLNPAGVLNISDLYGRVCEGKYADLVVANGRYKIQEVFKKGKRVPVS